MATTRLLRDVTFSNAAVMLSGSVAVPDHGGRSPGVVMVGGSGPSDRDNDTHFPPIRRHLVEAGITVLSYDKRGVGGSSGDWHDATIDDLAGDAVAALDFLRAQPGVLPDATGLFGHSEGGWVVLRAAARHEVPWVVINGCPGMTPAVQDRYALANILRQTTGATPDDIDAALAAYARLVEAGRRDTNLAEAARLFRSAPLPPVFDEVFDTFWAGMDDRLWGFTKRKQGHDPIPDVLRLRCPLLAIFGGADELVPIADSIGLFGTAACHPDRHPQATLTIEVFPHANHRIQIGTDLAPGYLESVGRWVTGRIDGDPGP
jgi:pimeloyl-ACP methyl ester carboxylesterase